MRPNIREAGQRTIQIAHDAKEKINPRAMALGVLAVGSLALVEIPHSHGLPDLLDHMASGILAIPTWELPTREGLTQMAQNPEGRAELAKFLAIDSWFIVLAHLGIHAILEKLPDRVGENKRLGIQPLPLNVSPSHVLLGASQVTSDLAKILAASGKNGIAGPIVGVHLDDGLPAAFGQEMDYHFRAHSLDEITGTHAPSARKRHPLPFVRAAGIDRAKGVLVAAFSPDDAVFYGEDASPDITPAFVSTLLHALRDDDLKGKEVRVILTGDHYFGETTPVERELQALARKHGFNLSVENPESVVMEEIGKRYDFSQNRESQKAQPRIVFAGEGRTEVDARMNARFASALEMTFGAQVDVVNHRRVGDVEVPVVSHDVTSRKARAENLTRLLGNADAVICYGDTDTGTSTAHALAVEAGADPDKVTSLVERSGNMGEFRRRDFSAIPIYETVLEKAFA